MEKKKVKQLVFRRSPRLFIYRLLLLQIATVLIVSILSSIEWNKIILLALISGGILTLWYIFTKYLNNWIKVDDEKIESKSGKEIITIRWIDIQRVLIGQTLVPYKKGRLPINYAIITGLGLKKIAFSDLSMIDSYNLVISTPDPVIVLDIDQSEILLAIVLDKTDKLPKTQLALDNSESIISNEHQDNAINTSLNNKENSSQKNTKIGIGIWVVILKVGGKLFKGIATALKTIKPGFALASGAAFALIWSWEIALALMFMLFIHEYGHVYAMKKSGFNVKGIYFIPFLGAAAVTEDTWKKRWDQAYIGLNGPVWGAALTLIITIIFAATDHKYLKLGSIASWWALINLFNLLPINPLDGGRVLNAIAYSISSKGGKIISLLMIIAAILITLKLKLYLFVIIGIVGILEYLSELNTTVTIKRLNFLSNKEIISADFLLSLRVLTRPIWGNEPKIRPMEINKYNKIIQMTNVIPMKWKGILFWSAMYILLTFFLISIMFWTAHYMNTNTFLEILK